MVLPHCHHSKLFGILHSRKCATNHNLATKTHPGGGITLNFTFHFRNLNSLWLPRGLELFYFEKAQVKHNIFLATQLLCDQNDICHASSNMQKANVLCKNS